MKKSNKFAWTWNIKEEYADDYVRLHADTWTDVLEAHSEAGIRNYSIFRNGNQFFYCFECDDVKAAFRMIDKSDACKRWNAVTSKMVEGSFDFGREEPIRPLEEIFYLE